MTKIISEATWLSVLRALHAVYGADKLFCAKEVERTNDIALRSAIEDAVSGGSVLACFKSQRNIIHDGLRLTRIRSGPHGCRTCGWIIEKLDNSKFVSRIRSNESD
jgi:hypothetical protein